MLKTLTSAQATEEGLERLKACLKRLSGFCNELELIRKYLFDPALEHLKTTHCPLHLPAKSDQPGGESEV